MEDWLKKELGSFEIEPQKESWEKIVFQTETTSLKKYSTTRYVLTLLCVCVTFLCLNVLTTISPRANKGVQKGVSPNLINNQTQTSRVVTSQPQKLNQKDHQDLTIENKQKPPTQTLELTKKSLLKKNATQIESNLFRKSDVSGLVLNPLPTTSFKKQGQIKKPTKLKKAKQKPYVQVNYKLTTQSRLASTNILSHKLEGLVFRHFRNRFSVGLGLGIETSKWRTFTGKKLNLKWYSQDQNGPSASYEERDFFVDNDTVFINDKILTPYQESSEKNYYSNNSFYAKDGKTVQIKENTLWLLSVPVYLRFDVLRKKDLVFRVTGTVNPQIIFNQNSVASHDELNVWVEDNKAFKKANMVYEGSLEFEKRINKNRYNLQFSTGFNPLKKQEIYKNEKPKNSIYGSIGLGYLFGK